MKITMGEAVWPCGKHECPLAFSSRKAVFFHEANQHGFALPEEYLEDGDRRGE